MPLHRIYAVWKHQLLLECVYLLLSHPEIEWLGSSSDHLKAYDEIQELQPETILVEEVERIVPPEIRKIIESSTWNVQVIGLNLNDNLINIYNHTSKEVIQRADFLELIIE